MSLLDSPDRFLNTGREPPAKQYRYNSQKERARTRQYTNELHVTSRCQHCAAEYTGRLEDARTWFTNHTCEEGSRG